MFSFFSPPNISHCIPYAFPFYHHVYIFVYFNKSSSKKWSSEWLVVSATSVLHV